VKRYCVVISLLALLSLGSHAEELPLEVFIKHGDYLDLKISPDGKHFAARIREKGQAVLVFIRRNDGKVLAGIKPGHKSEIHSVTWANNERVLFQFAEKRSYFEAPIPTGELYASNVDGSAQELIYGYRASDQRTGSRVSRKEDSHASHRILSILEGEKSHILILEYPWSQVRGDWYDDRQKKPIISKLNIYTGHKKTIESIPYRGAWVLADRAGNARFASWIDNDDNFHTAYRTANKEPWQRLDKVFNFGADTWPVSIDSSGTKAYLTAPHGDNELLTMFELNLTSGESSPLYVDLETDLGDWIIDRETGKPVVGISFPAAAKYHYADIGNDTVRRHKMLVRAFNGQDVDFTSQTHDGKLVLVRVESDINPGEYYIFNTDTKKADFLWPNLSWIDPRHMRQMQTLQLTARDGITLHSYLTLPEALSDQKSPLVVMAHGGPHGVRDYWEFNREVQMLASRGYAVLQVNYRGSGGYGGAYERLGYREWGGKMIDDIIDATRAVLAQETLDADRVCIYGASYGGYAALMSASREPDMFKCAIGYAGVYDLEMVYSKGDIAKRWGGEAYLHKVIGQDPEKLRAFSPIHRADKIKAAVMLIHGAKDTRVPVAHAKKMRKRFKSNGKDVEWVVFKLAGHGVWEEKNKKKLYTGLLRFLDKHIGDNRQLAKH